MRTEEHEKIIPSYTKKETIYIALDGTKFTKEKDCLNYEENLIEFLDVIINHVDDASTLDGQSAKIFNIKDEKDLEAVRTYENYYRVIDNYSEYGPGLYIWYADLSDEDCWRPDSYLENYKAYLAECEAAYKENERQIKEIFGEDITCG